MASLNKVILIGRVGKDPEVRYMPDGSAVVSFSLATSRKWKDKNTGEQREETDWHTVVIYGKLAEIVGQYVRKGSSIYVEGRLKTRKYQDKQSGTDRYATEVIADQMQMLGSKNDATEAPKPSAQPARTQNPPVAQGVMEMDDDIPFN